MSGELAVVEQQGREEASTGTSESDLSPAQLQLRRMVLDSFTSAHSRRNYAKALDLLFALAAGRPLTRALLMEYRTSMEGLAPSTVNVRLSAIASWSPRRGRTAWKIPQPLLPSKPPIFRPCRLVGHC